MSTGKRRVRSRSRLHGLLDNLVRRSRSPPYGSRAVQSSMSASDLDQSTSVLRPALQSLESHPHARLRDSSHTSRNPTVAAESRHIEILSGHSNESSGEDHGGACPADIWTAAFREAVKEFGKDIDVALIQGKSLKHLLEQLEVFDMDAYQQSAFERGIKFLRDIEVPLERFKMALDLASPFAAIEPTASAVVGVLKVVTAIAISLASANRDLAKKIGAMLVEMQWIDDCDTLGQKMNRPDIHQALVSVYKSLLDFYMTASEILARRGIALAMTMLSKDDPFPEIISDFLRHSGMLHKVVQKATLEIIDDIKRLLYDQEITRWLGGDKVRDQTQYHAQLRERRSDQACMALLADASYTAWCQAPGSCRLTVIGEMGRGKTMALAFMVDELRRRSLSQLPQSKVCYYYCRNDETGQILQILSALILALLEQMPGLKKRFYEWYKANQSSGYIDPGTDASKLGEFMQNIVRTLERPLYLVIDGLDECDQQSRYRLFQLVRTLERESPRLKTILSSRPQEDILAQTTVGFRMNLVSDPDRDSTLALHMVETRLRHLPDEVKNLVVRELSPLARGSAIWLKLVIEVIEIQGIQAFHPMETFLSRRTIPKSLSELYYTLLQRCTSNDSENFELARVALQLLAAARRPLSISELGWGVAIAISHPDITTVASLRKVVDHKRVLKLVSTFIYLIDFEDTEKRQIRLAHQSVKEFVVNDLSSLQPKTQTTWHTEKGATNLDVWALKICTRYLLLVEIGSVNLFTDEQIAVGELPQDIGLFSEGVGTATYDPSCSWESWEEGMIRFDPVERGFGGFFVYASCYWLDYLSSVTTELDACLPRVERLCRAGSIQLHNWIQQYRRPGCTILPRFEFSDDLYDPLSITCLYGSECMLEHMLREADLNDMAYLPSSVQRAADQILQWGDLDRLRLLTLHPRGGVLLETPQLFRSAIRQWSSRDTRRRNWGAVCDLIGHVSGTAEQTTWVKELRDLALEAGWQPVVAQLEIRGYM